MPSPDQIASMNKMLQQQNKLYEAQAKIQKSQLMVMRQMANTFQQMDMSQSAESIQQMNQALDEASNAINQLGEQSDSINQINEQAETTSQLFENVSKKVGQFGEKMMQLSPAMGAIEGLRKGMQATSVSITSVIGLAQQLISTAWNLSTAIISIPWKMLNGLMSMAADYSGTELRQALEDVRQEMGDMAEGESQAVIDAWQSINHFGGQLAETGASVWRTMGNMAESMKAVHQIASNMGSAFSRIKREFAGNVERIFAYVKGLGLAEDSQKALAERAISAGTTVQEQARQMTQMAYGLGEAFNINGKLISRDIGQMMSDFENFGTLGVETMAGVATHARQLGLEVEELTGTIAQFDQFESAAESAAQLSQAFGMQVNALEMIKEQDPAARFEKLRQAFMSTGRSVEDLTRQEQQLLAEQTGLSAKAIQVGFSAKNQAKSYEEVQNQAKKTKEDTLSQAEAMKELSDSIERLVKEGDIGKGGFIDRFIQGFMRGVKHTRAFWRMMHNLNCAIRYTIWAGVRVGRAFVRSFPGVEEVFTSISEFFSPDKWNRMMDDVVQAFRRFFKTLTEDPKASLNALMKNLQEAFFNWFDKSKSSGKSLLKGFDTFFRTIAELSGALIRKAAEGVTQSLRFIVNLIKDPSTAISNAKSVGGGFLGYLMDVFKPVVNAITDVWPDLRDAFMELFSLALDKTKNLLRDIWDDYWMYIVGAIVGPSLVSSMVSSLGFFLVSGIIKAVKGVSVGSIGGLGKLKGAFQKLMGSATTLSQAGGAVDTGAINENCRVAQETSKCADRTSQTVNRSKVSKASIGRMAVMAAVITAGLAALVYAIYKLAQQIQQQNISRRAILNASIIVIAAGGVLMEIAGILVGVAAASKMVQGLQKDIVVGMTTVGVAGAAIAAGAYGLIQAFGDIPQRKIEATKQVTSAISNFLITTIGVITASALIGGFQTLTAGIGTALIAAGMATLTDVSMNMVEHSKKIINTINSMDVVPNQRKIDVFQTTFEIIGNFAGMIARVSKATAPSFTDLITGGSMTERLTKVREIIQQQTYQIQTLARTIIQSVKNLPASPSDLKKANVIGDLLQTMADLGKVFTPPEKMLEGDWIPWGTDSEEKLKAHGENIEIMGDTLRFLMEKTAGVFSRTLAIMGKGGGGASPEKAAAASKALSSTMSSVSSLARAMTVFTSEQYIGGDKINMSKITDDLNNIIGTIMEGLLKSGKGGQNIVQQIGSMVSNVINSVGDLSQSEAKQVKALTPALQSGFNAVQAVATVVDSIARSGVLDKDARQQKSALKAVSNIVESLTGGLTGNLGPLFNQLNQIFGEMSKENIGRIEAGMESFETMFSSVDRIMKAIKNFGTKGEGGGTRLQETTTKMMTNLRDLWVFMTQRTQNKETMSLFEFISYSAPFFEAISGMAATLSESATPFANALNSVMDIYDAIPSEINKGKFQTIKTLSQQGMTALAQGIGSMVDNINSIHQDIQRLKPQNIDTTLQQMANKLGMEGVNDISIPMDKLNLNIKVEVKLLTEEIEKTLKNKPGGSSFAFVPVDKGEGGGSG